MQVVHCCGISNDSQVLHHYLPPFLSLLPFIGSTYKCNLSSRQLFRLYQLILMLATAISDSAKHISMMGNFGGANYHGKSKKKPLKLYFVTPTQSMGAAMHKRWCNRNICSRSCSIFFVIKPLLQETWTKLIAWDNFIVEVENAITYLTGETIECESMFLPCLV